MLIINNSDNKYYLILNIIDNYKYIEYRYTAYLSYNKYVSLLLLCTGICY